MALVVKNPSAKAGDVRDADSVPGGGRCPEEGRGNPLPYSRLESHGQRSLVGYSPWGHRESDMTEATQRAHMHTAGGKCKAPVKNSTEVPLKIKNSYPMIQQSNSWTYIWRKLLIQKKTHALPCSVKHCL